MWPDWWQPYVDVFVSAAWQLLRVTGASQSSYLRSADHNAAVGGEARSQHLLGIALDVVPGPGSSMETVAAYARALGFGYVLNEGDHVHVQLFPAGVLPDWLYDALVGQYAI